MASEQKLQSTDEKQMSNVSTAINPQYDSQMAGCCAPDSGHKGETVVHAFTAPPEDRREHVEGTTVNEGHGVGTGGQREGGEGAGTEERKKEEEEKATEEEDSENREEVPVGLLVSLDENGPSGEERADQGPQGTGEETAPETTRPQVPSDETDVQGRGTGLLRTGEETGPQVTSEETGPQVTGEETGPQVTGEETGPQVTCEETGPQVTCEETGPEVTVEGKGPQVTGEETGPQVTDEETGPEVTGKETEAQVTGEETGPQVTGKETEAHVTEEVTGVQGTNDEKDAQAKLEETCPQSTSEETDDDRAPPATIPEVGENVGTGEETGAQVSNAGEKWIDMLVHNIVTEVTGEGVSTEAQVSADTSNTTAVISEGEEHSNTQLTGTETMTGDKVTLQGAGAAVQVSDRQVSIDSTDIAAHESDEKAGMEVRTEVKGTPEQLNEEPTGVDTQVEEAATRREDSAGAQVIGEEVHEEEGGQVIASVEETDREVTPDVDTLPSREGTADQDRPVACREKEWPSHICTASEVRTVTAGQGDIQRGSDTPKEPSDKTPEMKEREVLEDGPSPTEETPIEREIRLAMAREMSLRQERGISSPIGQPDMVEVRRRTISVEPMAVPGKERQLAGAQMQREIQLETQREQDLVELGKVMGTYDRGHQQELQEKKLIFESMNTEPSDAPIKKKQSEPQQQSVPQEAPPSTVLVSNNYVAPAKETKKGPSYAEANGSNVIIIEHSSLLRMSAPGNTFSSAPADSRWSAPADSHRSAPKDSRRSIPAEITHTNSSGSPLPNSADSAIPPGSPFQLLRSPSPRSLLEREIEEVKEREKELQRQRSSIYGKDDSVVENTQKTQEINSDTQSFYQPERPNWRRLEVNWPPNKEAEMNGQQQVLNSPRNRRQRSALIQSWESGNPNPKDDE
ncbi:uncharacterized protein MISP3 isoform X3 [Bufo bufo]|uniref:uncharacterized protein MISP3 isoform X2 n=1 Tax=Bufo bufo TaxID=8384 RepID=UPI001ABDE65E|nr:uncharacterized protein MISP3 isoform X2 [Bufo bufo]XP_040271015.1 uncharacterized protein MISP3 isoform X3 [Bufo bufo]